MMLTPNLQCPTLHFCKKLEFKLMKAALTPEPSESQGTCGNEGKAAWGRLDPVAEGEGWKEPWEELTRW